MPAQAADPLSVHDLDRHQALLRLLLRSSITATVTFTVHKLKRLSSNGRLHDTATVPVLQPAALASAKTTALTALRLLADAVVRTPAAANDAVQAAPAGLEHPTPTATRGRCTAGQIRRPRADHPSRPRPRTQHPAHPSFDHNVRHADQTAARTAPAIGTATRGA